VFCGTSRWTQARPSRTSATGPARDSQEQWWQIRRALNAHRVVLAELAAELYPKQPRIPGSTILTSASWHGAPIHQRRGWMAGAHHPLERAL
jgi:hypothetical protein